MSGILPPPLPTLFGVDKEKAVVAALTAIMEKVATRLTEKNLELVLSNIEKQNYHETHQPYPPRY